MLTWLGIKKESGYRQTRQFFDGASKKTVLVTLASAMAVLLGVQAGLRELLTEGILEDSVGAVIPGVVGLLVAVVMVGIVERWVTDEKS